MHEPSKREVKKQGLSHKDALFIWNLSVIVQKLIFPYTNTGELYGYVLTDLSSTQ